MLNYVRHDEEFHCSIKLMNGDEIVGRVIVSQDEETNKDIIYIEEPLLVQTFTKEIEGDRAVKGMGFTKWQNFSDEEFFIISEDAVLTIASLSKEMIFVYESYLATQKAGGNPGDEDTKQKVADQFKVDMGEVEGSLGKIAEARKRLEDLFKDS
jgi:hypothetical protein